MPGIGGALESDPRPEAGSRPRLPRWRPWAAWIRECRNPRLWLSALGHVRQRRRLLRAVGGPGGARAADYVREIEDDAEFVADVRGRLTRWTTYRPRAGDFVMAGQAGSVFFNEVTLYAIVRAREPEVVVETGGTPGKSAAFMLRAMARNGRGHLYTIDRPPRAVEEARLDPPEVWHDALPAGATSGWAVPDTLRSRHTVLIGPSREHLPPLLARLHRLDMFFHDSDHSYENMTWEFETAWSRLAPGGLLLSDDVRANRAFANFARRRALAHVSVFNLGAAYASGRA